MGVAKQRGIRYETNIQLTCHVLILSTYRQLNPGMFRASSGFGSEVSQMKVNW